MRNQFDILSESLNVSLHKGLGLRERSNDIEPIELAKILFPWKWADYQRDILIKLLEPDWTRTILLAPPRHRKPLCEDTTLITMANGSYKLLKNIEVGDKIISHKGRGVNVDAVHKQGKLPTLKITTKWGREVYSAYDHPFLTARGWIHAEHLRTNDILTIIKSKYCWPNEDFKFVSFLQNCIYFKDSIIKIEEVDQHTHRCLSVSSDFSFVANDIVVHNTTILTLYIAIEVGKDPNTRVMVASHTKDFAALLISSVIKIMESPIYKRAYGNLLPSSKDGERWTTYEKHLPGRPTYIRDPTFICLSPDSGTPGYGADILLLDDIVTQANSSTPTLRKHISHWVHGSLLKRLEPDGKLIVNGNRFYVDDFYGEVLNDPGKKKWRHLIYPTSPENPIWPDRWGKEELLEKKLEDPIFYPGQYELNPLDLISAGTFDANWFQFYTTLPELLIPYAGIDLPITAKYGTSKYAEIIVARDPHGVIYVLDGYSGYHNGSELPNLMDELYKNWKPVEIAWESNGPQQVTMHLTEQLIKTDARFHGIPSEISKERRLASIAGKVRTGKVLVPGKVDEHGKIVPVGIGESLLIAWKKFPTGDLDLLDAFEKAVTLALGSPPPAASTAFKYDPHKLSVQKKAMKQRNYLRKKRFGEKQYPRVFR